MRYAGKLHIILSTAIIFLVSGFGFEGNNNDFVSMEVRHWYRGNTHTHARYSDKRNKNDVPEIAKWYRKAGYDFLMISEHNDHLSEKMVICHDEASKPNQFLMLCGLELSESRHLTALGINKFIDNEKSLQDGVNKTIESAGIPVLNHPLEPVVKAIDFIKTKGLNHLEVFNGNNPQDTRGCEMLWDSILSAPNGRPVYAVASDDNHFSKSKVGKGWIMVNAPALTKEDIKNSIRKGNFYATTGIILSYYSVSGKTIKIMSENGAQIAFIGRFGKILKKVDSQEANYQIIGNEYYIRIRISDNIGKIAWTQPLFLK